MKSKELLSGVQGALKTGTLVLGAMIAVDNGCGNVRHNAQKVIRVDKNEQLHMPPVDAVNGKKD